MSLTKSKYFQRTKLITLGGISSIFPAVTSALTSYLIIAKHSAQMWGEVVAYLVILEIAFSIISWGNRPFLLREFSINPSNITRLWVSSLKSRMPVLLLFLTLILLWDFSGIIKIWLVVWALGRFLYQSCEVLVQYNRHFTLSIMVEAMGLIILAGGILFLGEKLTVQLIVMLFAVAMGLKAIALLSSYAMDLLRPAPQNNESGNPNWSSRHQLVAAFPFFLVGFAGMLQSRADLYIVSIFMDKVTLGQYHVYLSFLIFSQVFASILLRPYAKNLMRLGTSSMRKLAIQYISAGIAITLVSTVAIYLVIALFYGFQLSFLLYVIGYFYVVIYYTYQIKAYELGRNYQQKDVATFGLVAGVINLVGSYLLIPIFSIEGALGASLLSQVVMALGLHLQPIRDKSNK